MIRESLRMAWRSLVGNKLRSALTMLGVVIGVAAVIALVTLGQGATAQVTSQVSALGTNLVTITPNRSTGARFTAADAAMLPERVPGIADAMPATIGDVTARWRNRTYATSLVGALENGLVIQDRSLAAGRYFTSGDVSEARAVAVLGQTVVDQLFQGRDPLGETITIGGRALTVVGVLAEKGAGGFGPNPDDMIVTPLAVAQHILGTRDVSVIYAETRSPDVTDVTVAHIQAIFDTKFGREDTVSVLSQQQLLDTVSSITATLTLLLGGIAGISLVVGGIGIMNIMLVTVTERTREIGLRKALGARRRAVLAQFLTESVFLTVVGGAIGIVLGSSGAAVLGRVAGFAAVPTASSVAIAFLFSAAVGILFGFWPAWSAARLDPIVALRRE